MHIFSNSHCQKIIKSKGRLHTSKASLLRKSLTFICKKGSARLDSTLKTLNTLNGSANRKKNQTSRVGLLLFLLSERKQCAVRAAFEMPKPFLPAREAVEKHPVFSIYTTPQALHKSRK